MYAKYMKPAVYSISNQRRWLCLPKPKYYNGLNGGMYIVAGLASAVSTVLFFAVWLMVG